MADVKTLPDFKLSFDDYSDDKERYSHELYARREELRAKDPDINIYWTAIDEVFDAYCARGLWLELADGRLLRDHEDSNERRLTEGLLETQEFSTVKKLWHEYLAKCSSEYWICFPWYEKKHLPMYEESAPNYEQDLAKFLNEEWPKLRDETILRFRAYRELVPRMNDPLELAWVEEQLQAVETGKRRKPKKAKPEPTKIDDTVFWEIIEQARSHEDISLEEILSNLSVRLEDFKSSEIKRFQNLLLDKLEELYTWDLWALAYIGQHGCSDDSFFYFRSWVILQGQAVFELCKSNVEAAMPHVPENGVNYCEGLLDVAERAYIVRSGGKEIKLRARKEKEPAGVEWDEDKVEQLYPEIAKYYRDT